MRRLLLALATTLIVARPLVEDVDLRRNLADPWGLVLTMLWLLAALGWAAWRYWLRPASEETSRKDAKTQRETGEGADAETPREDYPSPGNWYGGLVQVGLLAVVALVFVSAEWAASYKFPARLMAWEWLGLFVSLFVVRQLAVTPREQHGLFAVVMAGAVALAAQGIYQEVVELPSNRRLAEDREKFRKVWAEENPGEAANDALMEQARLRALENNIYGPYAHPNSYAGFLVLFLPGLIGAVVVCRRMRAAQWQMVLTTCCALVALAALWLTHSRGAMLGLAAAGLGAGLFLYRRQLQAHALVVLVTLVLLIGAGYGVWRSGRLATGKSNNPIAQRLEYWQTTWQMIRERPWLGVGPGNFAETYPHLMPPTAEEKISDPHNFMLEIWATCGVFALAALLAALAAFFVRIVRELGRAGGVSPLILEPTNQGADAPRSPEMPVRWEFYLGGMFGLLLGFVLRINTTAPNTIMAETFAAAVRSLVWFGAFGLMERLAWSDRGRLLALTTGIVALLLNLCVSGGISSPSLVGLLWVAVALALNAASLRPIAWLSRPGPAMILPLPIVLGLFLVFGLYVLYPVLGSDSLVREAVQVAAFMQTENTKPLREQARGFRQDPAQFVQKYVVERLEEARRLTPDDARIYVQLAYWTDIVWQLKRKRTRTSDLSIAEQALRHGAQATKLDPHGGQGYLVQYRIRMGYAELNENRAREAREKHADAEFIRDREATARRQYELAADVLEQFLPNDPSDTALHYMLAAAWFKSGDTEKGRRHTDEALQLDEQVTSPSRKLSDRQRRQLDDWKKNPPSS